MRSLTQGHEGSDGRNDENNYHQKGTLAPFSFNGLYGTAQDYYGIRLAERWERRESKITPRSSD